MLPSLTAIARRRPPRRATLGTGGALLLALALAVSAHASGSAGPVVVPNGVADTLAPGTWAIAVPVSWFATPIVGMRSGDRIDVIALRPGEHATATAVAFDLLVVSADERSVVFGTGPDDATALGLARASGLLLIPLLRSTR